MGYFKSAVQLQTMMHTTARELEEYKVTLAEHNANLHAAIDSMLDNHKSAVQHFVLRIENLIRLRKAIPLETQETIFGFC